MCMNLAILMFLVTKSCCQDMVATKLQYIATGSLEETSVNPSNHNHDLEPGKERVENKLFSSKGHFPSQLKSHRQIRQTEITRNKYELIGRQFAMLLQELSSNDLNNANKELRGIFRKYKMRTVSSMKKVKDGIEAEPVDLEGQFHSSTNYHRRRRQSGSTKNKYDLIGRQLAILLQELSENDFNNANRELQDILWKYKIKTICTPKKKTNVKPSIIRSLHINSDVRYRYATTLVSTGVVNPKNLSAEATFTLTLPESAFISGFLMEIKGQVYKAYVKSKEEAESIYQEAVDSGQSAGHGVRDSNQFRVTVNIEPHGKIIFKLTYEEMLERNLIVYRNVISLNPQQVVEDMSVTVRIEEPSEIMHLAVSDLQPSNDAVRTKPSEYAKVYVKSPNQVHVVWAPSPYEQNCQNSNGLSGQLVVEYDVNREESPQQVLVDEGYFVHFFAPEHLPKLRKHVIFVLDFSGSMEGRKLEQLREAMGQIFAELNPQDYFSLVIFHTHIEVWSPGGNYVEKEETHTRPREFDRRYVMDTSFYNIEQARSFMQNYSDLGMTNIMGGLRAGLRLADINEEMFANGSDPPQCLIFFLTDGQPNVEEDDPDVIVGKTKALNTKRIPIFSLAFGDDADLKFLRKISLQNSGFARNIYEAADAAQQLKNFYQAIASPLLSNVTFTYVPGQVDDSSQSRQDLPVFYSGSEYVVSGKLNQENIVDGGKIGEITGMSASGPRTYPITVQRVPTPSGAAPQNGSTGHLEKAWSYLHIQQLLDKADTLDDGDEKTQTREKALKVALKYGFVTPLTSLIVSKPNEAESSVEAIKVKVGDNNSIPPLVTLNSNNTDPLGHSAIKIPLEDVEWLKPILNNGNAIVLGYKYKIGINEPDSSFGECRVNDDEGDCRHIQHCALDVFQYDESHFLPYKCRIPLDYLGVCCPKYLEQN